MCIRDSDDLDGVDGVDGYLDICFGLLGLPWSALVCLGLTWSALVCLGLSWSVLVCFGLPWSTLIWLGLLGLFQITIERLKCSKAISGRVWVWDGMGWMGWKSLKALILRAPLCGANKDTRAG